MTNEDFWRSIIKTILFLSSALLIYSGVGGLTYCSTIAHINRLLESDHWINTISAMAVVLVGCIAFYFWRRMCGGGDKEMILKMTLLICIPAMIYGHHVKATNFCFDVAGMIKPPVVAGYDYEEGYIEQPPTIDMEAVNAGLDMIDDPSKREDVEEVLDTAYLEYRCYENSEDLYTCSADYLSNGNVITVSFKYDQELAKKNNVSFDNIFKSFEVTGLPERQWAN